jgi:hypothetical protein
MSELRKLATAKVPMYLDDRSPDGHIIVFSGGGSEHSFLRHRLGLSVECPVCGQVALFVDLVAGFYRRSFDNPAGAGGTRGLHDSERPLEKGLESSTDDREGRTHGNRVLRTWPLRCCRRHVQRSGSLVKSRGRLERRRFGPLGHRAP